MYKMASSGKAVAAERELRPAQPHRYCTTDWWGLPAAVMPNNASSRMVGYGEPKRQASEAYGEHRMRFPLQIDAAAKLAYQRGNQLQAQCVGILEAHVFRKWAPTV